MAALKELFGDNVLTKSGLKPTEEALSGKTAIGIYFSAHWCPPCRGFTPKLAEMYSKTFKDKGMEIVFVSSDKDQAAFDSYYGEQPWAALPYEQRDAKETLSKKFKVQGIPSFVILDGQGNVITKDGREAVDKDPTGTKYPWTPPTPAEKAKSIRTALGEGLLSKAGGKPIGLYFSAHWCPPCRAFTPKLAEWYKAGLKDKMEIIFVSSDQDKGAFDSYFETMPWLSLAYDKRDEKEELSNAFGVNGIPAFVVMNPDGSVITTEGRSKVEEDPEGKTLPDGWLPQPFNDVNGDPGPLNEEQCLIMFGDDAAAHEAVKTVANEYYIKANKDIDAMPLRFFSGKSGGVMGQIRNLTKVRDDKLVLVDIPDDGAFYVSEAGSVTVDTVKQFLADVGSKKVERKQLQK